jgi:hypothetical protein
VPSGTLQRITFPGPGRISSCVNRHCCQNNSWSTSVGAGLRPAPTWPFASWVPLREALLRKIGPSILTDDISRDIILLYDISYNSIMEIDIRGNHER